MINIWYPTILYITDRSSCCCRSKGALVWLVMTNIYLSVGCAKLCFIKDQELFITTSLLFWSLAKYGRLGALFNPKQPFIWPFSPGIPSDGFFPLENGEKLVTSDTNLNWGKKNKNKDANPKTSTTLLREYTVGSGILAWCLDMAAGVNKIFAGGWLQ